MASSTEHHAQAEQLLKQARENRNNGRPAEESDTMRREAEIHAYLSVGAALREVTAKVSPAAPAAPGTTAPKPAQP